LARSTHAANTDESGLEHADEPQVAKVEKNELAGNYHDTKDQSQFEVTQVYNDTEDEKKEDCTI